MKKLFIDDSRTPGQFYGFGLANKWDKVKTYNEAIEYFEKNGIPDFISFDHDLGEEKTGYDITKWLINQVLDGKLNFPKNFKFFVHSSNIVGKENIIKLLENFLEVKYHIIQNFKKNFEYVIEYGD